MIWFSHKHRWQDTRINPWCIVTEQRCACGEARHLWEPEDVLPLDAPVKWRPGPHPMEKNDGTQHTTSDR